MVFKRQLDPACITFSQANIIYNARFFWRQIIYWTRAFFNSAFEGIGNVEETYARLYNTPARFAYMLQLIIGRPASERYLALFNEYIVLLRQLVTAVLKGDTSGINESMSLLNINSEDMANLLSQIFPSLNKDVLKDMIDTHRRFEIEEINAYVSRDFSRIIEIYDNLEKHTDKMADYIAKGVIDLLTTVPESGSMQSWEAFKAQDQRNCITYNELNTILNIALFWVELFEWFRTYRISIATGMGNEKQIADRLIQVTVDLGNYLKTFFDEETVDAFILQMQEYLKLMGQLLEAQSANNIEEVNRIYQLLIYYLDQSAEFLYSFFPSIDKEEWKNELYRMNTNLINMGTLFLAGDYSTNIQIFDDLINQAEDLGFHFVEVLFK